MVLLEPGEDIDQLTAERVEDVARFVSDIGQRLTPAQEGIQEAVESADASGFNLELLAHRVDFVQPRRLPLLGT